MSIGRLIRHQFRKVSRWLDCVPKGRCRTIAFAVGGGLLVCFGLLMVVLPGPGLLVLAIGLAVLSAEFVWARALVRRIRQTSVLARKRYRRRSWKRRLSLNNACN